MNQGDHKEICVFVQSLSLELGYMVTCYELIFVVESAANATAIGYCQAIFKFSYAIFISDKSINSIIESRG